MNLLLIEREELRDDGTVRLAGRRLAHLREVLAAATGDSFRIGVVDGPRGTGIVRHIDTAAAELACVLETCTPDRPPVDVLLALPRPKVLRRLFAQFAALGVGRIMLTNASRVERHYFDTHILSPQEYRPLLIEGLQQARDTRVPEVSVHRQFRILVEDHLDTLAPDGVRAVAHPTAATPLADVVNRAQQARVVMAIGPEGGWNQFELQLLEAHRFHPITLGARTLRSDTACVALITLAHESLRAASLLLPRSS